MDITVIATTNNTSFKALKGIKIKGLAKKHPDCSVNIIIRKFEESNIIKNFCKENDANIIIDTFKNKYYGSTPIYSCAFGLEYKPIANGFWNKIKSKFTSPKYIMAIVDSNSKLTKRTAEYNAETHFDIIENLVKTSMEK